MNGGVIRESAASAYLNGGRDRIMTLLDMRAERNNQLVLIAMAVTLIVASAIPAAFIVAGV